jgi:hypothetical protein
MSAKRRPLGRHFEIAIAIGSTWRATAVAALGAADRPLQCSLGTAWVGNFELPEGVQGRSPSQMVLPAPTGARPAIWVMPC